MKSYTTLALLSSLALAAHSPLFAAEPADEAPPMAADAASVAAASQATGSAEKGSMAADGRYLPDMEQQRLAALAKSQSATTEALWLETQHESFLGLLERANTPNPAGVVILLHHDRSSPDWPELIAPLRKGFPDIGWHSLSLALPDTPLPPVPGAARPDSEETPVKAKDAQGFAERVDERINAALDQAQRLQATRVILLGVGSGGYWAARFGAGSSLQTLSVVLIDAQQATVDELPPMTEFMGKNTITLLDLYHGASPTGDAIENGALARANQARRNGKSNYLKVRMPPRASNWKQTDRRLLGTLRGLIRRNIEKR